MGTLGIKIKHLICYFHLGSRPCDLCRYVVSFAASARSKPAIVGDHSLRATWDIDPTISYLARFGKEDN